MENGPMGMTPGVLEMAGKMRLIVTGALELKQKSLSPIDFGVSAKLILPSSA